MLAALLLSLACAFAYAAQPITDFTFAHCSDDHNLPKAGTTIAEFKDLKPILLKPYNVTALPVSFVIDTGDATEFGPWSGGWQTIQKFYEGVTIPQYFTIGNHDGTWRSLYYELKQLYGSVPYSFDKNGCHFAFLASAGMQDPRPNFGPEQINWLAKDLAKVGKDVPVFLAFHHPLPGSEFATPYEYERVMDVIRPYNVVLILVGHGHSARHSVFQGVDELQGGSTYGPGPAGYQVITVKDGVLYAGYKDQGQPEVTKAMLTKPLAPPAKRYPAIKIDSPKEAATLSGSMAVKVWVGLGRGDVADAYFEIDGENKTTLNLVSGGAFVGNFPLTGLEPGGHSMRVTFVGPGKAEYHKSTYFYIDSTRPKVLWRVQMGTASKTTPTLGDSLIYIGGFDGTVRAYNRKTGKWRWTYQTGGPVLGQILLLGDKVYAGSGDKYLYCLNAADGKFAWKFQADDPIASWPVSDGTAIYFGCGTGAFYAVDAKSGTQVWKNTDATYNVESKPFLANGKVYYGAWDQYVYCLNTADGKQVWKCVGQGASEGGAARYYSPGDAGPVLCGGTVFAPDRKYKCALISDATGQKTSSLDRVAAATLSADGKSVYLRKLGNRLQKADSNGASIWEVDAPADDIPAPPCEAGAIVYTCSRRGKVSARSASDGSVLWEYQATPSLQVLAGINGTPDTAYVVATDGTLTALVDPTPGAAK